MAGVVLLDTNVLLYRLQGKLAGPLPEGYLTISFITEMELLAGQGSESSEASAIRQLLTVLNIINIDSGIKSASIEVRRKYRLRLPDAIIAGTALVLDATLWTADQGFGRVSGLRVHRPAMLGLPANS